MAAASSPDQHYVYEILPERSVRLVDLVELRSGDTALRLTTHLLRKAPEYNALSYVWGPESSLHSISILDQHESEVGNLQIQHNLYQALPSLRAASDKPIWIDAVCINQRDLDEKARVVPQMGNLYGHAAEVLIWLGPQQDRSELAMDLLNWMWFPQQREICQLNLCEWENLLEPAHLAAILSALTNGAHVYHLGTDITRLGIPQVGNVLWSALPALYRRDWFFRVWTFQEIMLAKKATVLCGDRSVPWSVFQQLGDRLSETQILWIDQPSGQQTFSPLRSMDTPHQGGEWFWRYLREARDRSCRFKEDRIYGMLALAPDSIRAALPVVYQYDDPDNYAQVYRNATVVFLNEFGLEVVLVAAPRSGQVQNLPSWCPDWSLKALSNAVPARFQADPAHLNLQKWFVDSDDRNILHVRGLQIDTVREVIDDYTYHWPNGVSGIGGPADNMLQWLDRCEDMARRTLGSEDAANEGLWKTLVSHSDKHNQPNFPPEPVHGLRAHRKRLAENRDSVPFSQTALTSEDIQGLGPYLAYIGVLWPGKVFFCTEGGNVGLADKGVTAGDKICMLFGVCRYLVLRLNTKDTQSLISVAYVHGLMNDAVRALRSRDSNISLERSAQVFNLC